MNEIRAIFCQILLCAVLVACSNSTDLRQTGNQSILVTSCPEKFPSTTTLDDGYYQMQLCGWSINMSEALFNDELGQPVYDNLSQDLARIQAILPTAALTDLKSVSLWVELDVPAFPGGVYHPSENWLRDNGYPTKWAKGVQLGNAQNFLSWTQEQPAMVLHEFSHAYDDKYYGNSNPDLLAAFSSAEQSGIYEAVEYVLSTEPMRAYALNNTMEYFAELTEAYFWQNDYYPFNRADLQQHDPVGFAAVEKMWRRE